MADFQQTCNLFKVQQDNSLQNNLKALLPFVEESFGNYLMRNNFEYTIDTIETWLKEFSLKWSTWRLMCCRKLQGKIALLAFDEKEVRKRLLSKRTDAEIIALELPDSFEKLLSRYKASHAFNHHSPGSRRSGLYCILKFLKFTVSKGVSPITSIDLSFIGICSYEHRLKS